MDFEDSRDDGNFTQRVQVGCGKAELRGDFVPFSHLAIFVSLSALALRVLVGLVSDINTAELHLDGWLGWAALGTVALPAVVCLWDRDAASDAMAPTLARHADPDDHAARSRKDLEQWASQNLPAAAGVEV